MVHIVSVTFCLVGPEAALLSLLLLDLPLPQAATAKAAVTTRAIAAGAIAILLRTIFSSFTKTFSKVTARNDACA
jgi:hypothetical protein